ncbi:MAG: serine--tRNA ligase [Cenarchaeum symbiont of Oopsacas minuta]|nr:serine--tRNA ligase [Cenarchaeum symbiont of Oopsacas minuta]
MLDPNLLREKPDEVRRMLNDRHIEFDIDGLLHANQMRLKDMAIADELRQQRNKIGKMISEVKKSNGDATDLLKKMADMSEKMTKVEIAHIESEKKYHRMAFAIPNMLERSVPIGADASANKMIRKWGNHTEMEFEAKSHLDVAAVSNLIDMERAAKTAGSRFYYLRDGLVRLNQAIISYSLDYLSDNGYGLVQPPYMINRAAMEGAVIAEDFEDVIYKIEDEDLYLVGTSEHAMAAMHSDEIIKGDQIPKRYAGVSPCFRKEAGAHGRDQKGIFRVHQFEKIEQFVFARPDESSAEHEKMLEIAEKFYQNLNIPYRVMLLCTGDMGKVSAKTYDIEAWMPGQKAYREVVSCSNCLDYQTRRLLIRFREHTNEPTTYPHTLNSTLAATTRVMVAILENFQTKDGHVSIPEVLRPYMGRETL